MTLRDIQKALESYTDLGGAKRFFEALRYPTIDPLQVSEIDQLPESAKRIIHSCHLISDCRQPQLFEGEVPTPSRFRIYHIELKTDKLRRTDFRRILEPFYRRFPQGNNLFVFTLPQRPYRELAFVSPQRLLRRREQERVFLHLRTLRVLREEPYATDLEILQEIANPPSDPQAIWERHESAFNIERVTEKFFNEYRDALNGMIERLRPTNGDRSSRFAYAQLLLNRLMVCYFLARKGWLVDGSGRPIRRYMRWLWKQYQQNKTKETSFHQWLTILFRDAFNMELGRLASAPIPDEVRHSFQTVPYLNGGLFAELEPDTFGYEVPDDVFSDLLFGYDPDREPKLLERYNFTVDESRPFDEEMAVDPEMLGKVYESLIAEEERGKAGIFYTPRLEVDLMCRLSIAEYLHERLGLSRDKVLEFVFSPTEETLKPFSIDERKAIEKALRDCKIVDPAVGSGSFLVGALNVLCDLLDALATSLDKKRHDRYELKKQLILNNLYGVDVKDWAVRVCELRLFLSLLVELPDGNPPRSGEPILPNLNFRIRFGDSIIQEVPYTSLPIILRKERNHFELPIHRTLKKLIAMKKELEKTPPTYLAKKEQEVLAEERKIVAEILDHYLRKMEREMQGTDNPQRQQMLGEFIKLVRGQKERLERGEPIPLFFWEVAFPEVFFPDSGEPGFDIVLANPPYVRQEKIKPPTPLSPQNYKAAIQRNIEYLWDNQVKVPGRADLYVPFFFVGISLLKQGGVLCFVTSNAWLDVDYGSEVQKFFLTKTRWLMTIDNLKKRTFAGSDINTVITLAVRPKEGEDVGENIVRFVAFRVPYEELMPDLMGVALEEIYEATERKQEHEYRVTPKTQRELYLEGIEEQEDKQNISLVDDWSTQRYVGNKLGGKYLRAPDIFFTILEKGKGKLVPLGEIAEVRRGFTTGANEFFYLQPVGVSVKDIVELQGISPTTPVRVRNDAGWEGEIEAGWLHPVIKSPREIRTLRVRLEDLSHLLFMPPKEVREGIRARNLKPLKQYPNALAYIRWGERQGYHQRPTCKSRNPWWDVGEQEKQDVILLRFRDQRNWTPVIDDEIAIGDVVFVGKYLEPRNAQVLNALLNSTVHLLTTEVLGRVNLGEGLLTTYGPEIIASLCLHPNALDGKQCQRLLPAFQRLCERPVRSIFEELGFELCRKRRCDHPEHPYEQVTPEALTLEQVQRASPDRFELDTVIFDVLGLTDEERLEVYRAVAQLVKDRLLKAKSVKKQST
jgi:hypothetical protein